MGMKRVSQSVSDCERVWFCVLVSACTRVKFGCVYSVVFVSLVRVECPPILISAFQSLKFVSCWAFLF